MLADRRIVSSRAEKLSGPVQMEPVCGNAGDVVFLDARALHARGDIGKGNRRNMWYVSTRDMHGAKSRAFKVFGTPAPQTW